MNYLLATYTRPTGLAQLDNLLGSLNEGLYLLAGPPGMGKTTIALQIATAATKDVPVVIVTFEHVPANLTLKLLCARAGFNLRDVQRGYADLAKLRSSAEAWAPVGQRLAVVEGGSQLTVAQVRAQARRTMRQHQAERCLVVVDCLQAGTGPLWVCEGAFDVLSLLAVSVPCVVAIFGVHGWRWDWAREVRALVFALDADGAGQQQWRQLARQAALRGKGGGNVQ